MGRVEDSFQPPKASPSCGHLQPTHRRGLDVLHDSLLSFSPRWSPGPRPSTHGFGCPVDDGLCPALSTRSVLVRLFVSLGFSETGRPAAFQPRHRGADHEHRVSRSAAQIRCPARQAPWQPGTRTCVGHCPLNSPSAVDELSTQASAPAFHAPHIL